MYRQNSSVIEDMINNIPNERNGNMDFNPIGPPMSTGYIPRNLRVETVTEPSPQILDMINRRDDPIRIKDFVMRKNGVDIDVRTGQPIDPRTLENIVDPNINNIILDQQIQKSEGVNKNMINPSPYPTPLNMVTGIGMQNYAMPYNMMPGCNNNTTILFYNNTPVQQTIMNQPIQFGYSSYPKMYMDVNQPTQQIYNSMPINQLPPQLSGYTNPYLGVGQSFGNRAVYSPNGFYIPSYQSSLAQQISPEDIQARSEGFLNAAEKLVNDHSIMKKIRIMAYKGAGANEELVEKISQDSDKKFMKAMDEYEEYKQKGGYSQISLNTLGRATPNLKAMKLYIKKGDEIIGESKEGTPLYIDMNKARQVESDIEMAARNRQMLEYQQSLIHANAIERQFDDYDVFDMFNNGGFNLIHHHYKDRELVSQGFRNKPYFDDVFRDNLEKFYSSPINQARIKRIMETRKEEEKEANRIREEKESNGEFQISSGVTYDTKTGEINFTIPPEIERMMDSKPLIKGTSLDKEYKEKMKDKDERIKEFLKNNVDNVYLSNRGYNPIMPGINPIRNISYNGYIPGQTIVSCQPNRYSAMYDGARGYFMQQVNSINKYN